MADGWRGEDGEGIQGQLKSKTGRALRSARAIAPSR